MAICDSEPSLNLLPPPSGHMGGGIQNPLLPCAGQKKGRVSQASFPPLLPKGEREFAPPPLPSLFSSSSLPLSLVPSLGHGSSLCPSWAVLGPAYTLPGPPRALLLAPPWASLGHHWALPGPSWADTVAYSSPLRTLLTDHTLPDQDSQLQQQLKTKYLQCTPD